jgi:hypothetical protein
MAGVVAVLFSKRRMGLTHFRGCRTESNGAPIMESQAGLTIAKVDQRKMSLFLSRQAQLL